MKVAIFQFRLFGINSYVVYDPATLECAVIDPGMSSPQEEDAIVGFIEKNNLKVTSVINTHLHLDHAAGNGFLKARYGVPVKAHKGDLFLGERMQEQARMFGLTEDFSGAGVTEYLEDGDVVEIGEGRLQVIAVPGHSAGSIAFYDAKDGFVLVGDALFQGSIGRTDLPGGDYGTLLGSIRNRLMTLPDSTVVYSGHGPSTTIGAEKRSNPYLRSL